MRWIRRLLRRYMRPMHEYDAMRMKHRMALLYAFCAWNCVGLVGYYMYTGRADWAHYYGLETDEQKNVRPGVYYADTLGVKKATIYQLKGFELSEPYEYLEENHKPKP